MTKKIYRSQSKKMIAGVCAGLGDYLDIDPTIIRLLFVALLLITAFFPMFIFYIIAWIIIPFEGSSDSTSPAEQTPPSAPSSTKKTGQEKR